MSNQLDIKDILLQLSAPELGFYLSRHQPDVRANQVLLGYGDKVIYRLRSGEEVIVDIKSGPMTHAQCPTYGYEGVFSDTKELEFADNAKIIGFYSGERHG